MNTFVTRHNSGNHTFNWDKLDYSLYHEKMEAQREEAKQEILATIRKERKKGVMECHRWELKIPPKMTPSYYEPDIYLPEWQFGWALQILNDAYTEYARTNKGGSILRLQNKGDYFNPLNTGRWNFVGDDNVVINLEESDFYLEEIENGFYDDYNPFHYEEDNNGITDWLIAECFRAAYKGNISYPVSVYFGTFRDYDAWDTAILYTDNEKYLKEHSEIEQCLRDNDYAEVLD